MANHGTFYWNELSTTDVDGAKAFYSKVLGWDFDEMPNVSGGTYWILKSGDEMAGGLMAMPEGVPEGTPPHWMSYVAVDDVDEAIAKAADLGGVVLMAPFDIPNVGRMGVIKDPQGAVLSLMTPAPQG